MYITARYNMFKTDDGLFHSAELLDEIVKYINTGGFDAVIFGGDLLDYFSNENYKTWIINQYYASRVVVL